MSNLRNDLLDRLREGGWVFDRARGKHELYKHPSGATYQLPRNPMADCGRRRMNALKAIEKMELDKK